MNGATLPPWLTPWASGLVYGQRLYKPGGNGEQPARERLRPRLTIYTLGHEHNAPILSWSENGVPSASPMEAGVAGSAVRWERVPMGAGGAGGPMRWERVPLDNSPWHMGVPVPVQPDIIDRPPLLERAEEGAAGAAAWGAVARGWAAGAALLALLVFIARIAEHAFDWKCLLRRQRGQREWQRPGVRSTCRTEEGFVIPGDPEAGPACSAHLSPPPRAADLPPPYSEMSPGGAPKVEEPPPPYLEGGSCVRFINKNGIPVLVFNRERAARDPEGRRRVQRILRAAGIDLAALGAPPLAPGLREAPSDRDSPIDFNPTSVISIVTNDNEVETCVIGEASAPKNADVEEGSSQEGTSVDIGASAAETTTANTNGDDDAGDGAVAV